MTERDAYSLKIPAYLRGELSAQEQAEIENLISKNSEFAADMEFQKMLRESFKAEKETEIQTEFGWARLSKAIDIEPITEMPLAANDKTKVVRFWKYAAVFSACAIIGQGLFMGGDKPNADDKYFMATSNVTSVNINVELLENARSKAVTEFLLAHDGIIISGPNKNSQYVISFDTVQACELATSALISSHALFETFTSCKES